jgi:hypothetical protein
MLLEGVGDGIGEVLGVWRLGGVFLVEGKGKAFLGFYGMNGVRSLIRIGKHSTIIDARKSLLLHLNTIIPTPPSNRISTN